MRRHPSISSISLHAQQVAWFEAWLRAARANVSGSAEVAAAQLHPLGVKVCTVLKPKEPRS